MLPLVLTLGLAAVAFVALRGVRPAAFASARLGVVALLLLAQLGVLHGFHALSARTGWGIASASPPGLAFLTQALRFALLLLAVRAWLAFAGEDLASRARSLLAIAAVLLLGFGGEGMPFVGGIALYALLSRARWAETIGGWRRAVFAVLAPLVLLAVSIVPITRVVGGAASTTLALATDPWPPALLAGATPAAAELAGMRPLDKGVQGLLDLLRVQLLVLTVKLWFLPIRLSGMSLKRRFMVNHLLVRSIPTFLSGLLVLGLLYVAIGHLRVNRLTSAFEESLARAGTTARAVVAAETSPAPHRTRLSDPDRLDGARRWMGPDSASAHVVALWGDSATASPGSPASLAGRDSSLTRVSRGLVVTDAPFLVARQAVDSLRSVAVFVAIDSSYLKRVMRPLGGDATLTVQPHVFLGGPGVQVESDTVWTRTTTRITAHESLRRAGRSRPWPLAQTYLAVGEWDEGPGAAASRLGAVEVRLATTPRSLALAAVRSVRGLYAHVFTILLVLGALMAISMVEGFAVRSGRSIVSSITDEVGVLRDAAGRFGRGELDYRLPVRGRDELSALAASFNDMAASLERQQRELLAKERLEEDLAVARQIQRRFLPQESPRVGGLEVAGTSLPSLQVGGDLFHYFGHPDGAFGVTLGDVAGKSVPAALLMSNVLAALRAQMPDGADVGRRLERVNELVLEQGEPGRFVTLFLGEFDPRRETLRYASAGHLPPLLVRASGALEWLREGAVPLGVIPGTAYGVTAVSFAPGDTLIVYSDGVTEAQGPAAVTGGEPELFGEERLAAVARPLRGRSAREVLDGVLAAVATHARGLPQADDITLVVVCRDGGP